MANCSRYLVQPNQRQTFSARSTSDREFFTEQSTRGKVSSRLRSRVYRMLRADIDDESVKTTAWFTEAM